MGKIRISKRDISRHIPVDDLKDHEQSDCWCKSSPEKQDNGNLIIVHNSADGREFFEKVGIDGH